MKAIAPDNPLKQNEKGRNKRGCDGRKIDKKRVACCRFFLTLGCLQKGRLQLVLITAIVGSLPILRLPAIEKEPNSLQDVF